MITKYRNRVSGPLLDRIDIHIEVPAVKYKEMAGEATGETSEKVRQRVAGLAQSSANDSATLMPGSRQRK